MRSTSTLCALLCGRPTRPPLACAGPCAGQSTVVATETRASTASAAQPRSIEADGGSIVTGDGGGGGVEAGGDGDCACAGGGGKGGGGGSGGPGDGSEPTALVQQAAALQAAEAATRVVAVAAASAA